MFSSDVRILHKHSSVVSTGGIGLMVGSLLMSLSALSVYQLNHAQDISVNIAPWNSLSDIRFALEKGPEPMGPLLSEGIIPEIDFVGPSRPLVIAQAKTTQAKSKPSVTVAVRKPKSKWLAKAKSMLKPSRRNRSFESHLKDRLESAPLNTPNVASSNAQASPTEMTTLRSLHELMRNRFLLAMNNQPQISGVVLAQVNPQVPSTKASKLAAVIQQSAYVKKTFEVTEVDTPHDFNESAKADDESQPVAAASTESSPHSSNEQQVETDQTASNEPSVKDSDVAAVVATTPQPVAEPQVLNPISAADIDTTSLTTQFEEVQNAARMAVGPQHSTESQDIIGSSQAAPQIDYSAINKPQAEPGASAGILVAAGDQQVWIKPTSPAQKTAAPQPASHAQVLAQVTPPAPSLTSSLPKMNTQGMISPPADVTTQIGSDHSNNGFVAATDDYSMTSVVKTGIADLSAELLNTQLTAFQTEAFDWVSPVSGGSTVFLTKEAGSRPNGWVLSKAQDHWPTLARKADESIPLISTNTGKLLSALAGASLQTEAAIVFGKIPSGWSVRLSGRSERPVFLNERNQSISQSSLEGERYFAFLNVAPGSHLLYLTDRAGIEQGAVGIAAIAGTSTYTNLTQIRRTSFTGRILDGSDSHVRAMPNVTVRVLGALNTHTESDRSGRFTIENVLTVGDYPVYVETDAPTGYTHRYQLGANGLHAATLYRLSDAAIQTWISQLEGTISPESGIVIAAAPGILSNVPAKLQPMPVVKSLASNPTLRPEVYTLSPSGQMQVGLPLDTQSSRFVSVQVPEGPAISQIIDAQHNLIWSEMIMSSPAVVNIVGPF